MNTNKINDKNRLEMIVSYIESVTDFNFMLQENNIICSEYETLVKFENNHFTFYAIDFEHCFNKKNMSDFMHDLQSVKKHVGRANYALKRQVYINLVKSRIQYLKNQIQEKKNYKKMRKEFMAMQGQLLIDKKSIYRYDIEDEYDINYDEPTLFSLDEQLSPIGEPSSPERFSFEVEPSTPFKKETILSRLKKKSSPVRQLSFDEPSSPTSFSFNLEPQTPFKKPKPKKLMF